jgi:hypothetical protein
VNADLGGRQDRYSMSRDGPVSATSLIWCSRASGISSMSFAYLLGQQFVQFSRRQSLLLVNAIFAQVGHCVRFDGDSDTSSSKVQITCCLSEFG